MSQSQPSRVASKGARRAPQRTTSGATGELSYEDLIHPRIPKAPRAPHSLLPRVARAEAPNAKAAAAAAPRQAPDAPAPRHDSVRKQIGLWTRLFGSWSSMGFLFGVLATLGVELS